MNDDTTVRIAVDTVQMLRYLHEKLGMIYWDMTDTVILRYNRFFEAFKGYDIQYGEGIAFVVIDGITFKTYTANGVGDDV